MNESIGVLFVCMGNICRSPTAEGVFVARVRARPDLADVVHADSAGTHDYHPGKMPDPRSRAAASRRGYDITNLRARVVVPEDFERFDYVLAMDGENRADLEKVCPASRRERLHTLLSFAPDLAIEDVPDPYFGGSNGFETVLDLVEAAVDGVLEHLTARLRGRG